MGRQTINICQPNRRSRVSNICRGMALNQGWTSYSYFTYFFEYVWKNMCLLQGRDFK